MPVKDLPKTLEDLLETLLAKKTLASWQIYDEKSGKIVVKLRFSEACSSGGTTERHGQISYKRKSQKQIVRDAQRTAKWRDNVENVRITRSMAQKQNMDIEQPRGGFNQCDISAISVPAIPVSPGDPASNDNINNSTWSSSEPCQQKETSVSDRYNTHDIDTTGHMKPFSPPQIALCMEKTCEKSLDVTHDNSVKRSINGMESECQSDGEQTDQNVIKIDSDEESMEISDCDNKLCYYYSGPDDDEAPLTEEQRLMYHCDLCRDLDICSNCVKSGAHKRHNKHLRTVTAPPWID